MAASVTAQNVQKLTANKISDYGIIYALPVTVVDVTVEAEKTERIPGEFYKYAGKYLGEDPITTPSTSWRVKSVTANTRGVADKNEEYLIQFKSGSTPYIMVDDNQMPVSVNIETDYSPEVPALPKAVAAPPSILETPAAREAVTQDMLKSQSSAKRAELAAQRIYELRQTRNDIISGEADNMPSDGEAMRIALETLSRQEEALTAMFLGTTKVSTDVKTFTVKPDSVDTEVVFARLSAIDGIVDAGNLSGDPLELKIKVNERGELPVNEKGEVKRFPKGGMAYRVPGRAEVSVNSLGRNLFDKEMEFSQYGVVFGLDPDIFTNKKSPAYVVFSPVTGGIREIGTKSNE